MREEQHLPRTPHQLEGLLHGGVRWDGDDGGVETATAREAVDLRGQVWRVCTQGVRGSEAASEFEAWVEQVCSDDLQAAQCEKFREHEANRPADIKSHSINFLLVGLFGLPEDQVHDQAGEQQH